MGKRTGELIQFIKSLTPQEKIWIRQYAALTVEDAQYLELMDYFSKVKEYDESHLKAKFKGRKFLKNLSRAKMYLFDAMLDALATFFYEPESELQKIERKITIAEKKRSLGKAEILVRNGRKLAQEFENFEYELAFLERERVILFNSEYEFLDKIPTRIQEIREEIEVIEAKRDQVKRLVVLYENLVLELRHKYRMDGRRDVSLTQSLSEEIEKIFAEDGFLSEKAIFYARLIRRAVFGQKMEFEKSYAESSEILGIFENRKTWQEIYQDIYLRELRLNSLLALHLEKLQKGIESLEKLKSTKVFSVSQSAGVFAMWAVPQLTYALTHEGYWELGEAVVKEYEETFEERGAFYSEEYKLRLNNLVTQFYIWKGESSKGKKWITKSIYFAPRGVRNDLQALARLLYLIILFEERDWIGISEASRSFASFVQRNAPDFTVTHKLIKLIKRCSRKGEKEDFQPLFRQFTKKELTGLVEPEKAYFNFRRWIERNL